MEVELILKSGERKIQNRLQLPLRGGSDTRILYLSREGCVVLYILVLRKVLLLVRNRINLLFRLAADWQVQAPYPLLDY